MTISGWRAWGYALIVVAALFMTALRPRYVSVPSVTAMALSFALGTGVAVAAKEWLQPRSALSRKREIRGTLVVVGGFILSSLLPASADDVLTAFFAGLVAGVIGTHPRFDT